MARAAAPAGAPGVAAAAQAAAEPVVVGVTVNGHSVADSQLVHRSAGANGSSGKGNGSGNGNGNGNGSGSSNNGSPGSDDSRFWVPVDAALAWRIDLAGRPTRDFQRRPHVALCDLRPARETCVYDEASAQLTVTLPTSALLPLRIAPELAADEAPTDMRSGGFLNYDISGWRYGRAGVSAFGEGRAYSSWGHGAARIAGTYTSAQRTHSVAQAVWQIDRPSAGRSIQLGSIAIPDTALGPGLPLTGVRLGSNAALNPRLPPVLRPSVDGVADRPMRTDIFVDGTYRQTAQVPYGPYQVELLPQLSGRGDIEMVSTDPAGVQTRVVIPYYQAPQMLAPGASEWSLDAGRVAAGVAPVGDSGGNPLVASASWRRGLTRRVTAQAQALASPHVARVALGGDLVTPQIGASGLGVVWQRSPAQGSRVWLGIGQEYLSRDLSASVRSERIVGACPLAQHAGVVSDRLARACERSSAVLSSSVGARASVAMAIEQLREADGRRGRVSALTGHLQLGPFSQLGLSLQQVNSDQRKVVVAMLTFSRPLGSGYAVQTSVQRRSDIGPSLQWSTQKLPAAEQLDDGPRFAAYGGLGPQQNSVGARWAADAQRLSWRTEVRADGHGASGSAGVDGAIGFAEGRTFMARRINDAFVVVDAGLPGLPVLLDNREVARTNADGFAIVTQARARQVNQVGVDTSALPVQYAIARDQIGVVPGIGSGALARFDPSDGGVLLAVRDAAGQRLPTGAVVTVSSQRLTTAVTSAGEVFLDRSDRPADLSIDWGATPCTLRYEPGTTPAGGYRCQRR